MGWISGVHRVSKGRRLILGLVGCCLALGGAAGAEEDVPAWFVGSWYELSHGIGLSYANEPGTLDLNLASADSRWTYTGDQELELVSTGSVHLCHVLELVGTMGGSGGAALGFPAELTFPLELRAGTIEGEAFVASADLGLVARRLRITGEVWGQPWSSAWIHLGALEVDLTEELDPPLDVFGFPIQLGRSWSQGLLRSTAGLCSMNLSVLGKEYDLGGRIDQQTQQGVDWSTTGLEQIGDWTTYRSFGQGGQEQGETTAWYAPEAAWWVKLERRDLPVGSTGATLELELLEVTEAQVGPEATPTPAGIGVNLVLASRRVSPGDTFALDAFCYNDGPPRTGVPLFVILDVYGTLFFWPSWVVFPEGVDFETILLPTGGERRSILPSFVWPDTGTDAAEGLLFYGAMLTESWDAIWGDMDTEEFAFGP